MKSNERMMSCPVCHKMVSIEWLSSHIGQMARYEQKEKFGLKKHHLYKLSHKELCPTKTN